MASLLNPDGEHVLVTCSCSAFSPLTRLYFCRHCIELRCQLCVSHEVDSYYCPNCLENMPSAEAKLKRNRCANCFDCPSCGNTLSTRATAVAIQSEDSKTTQAKKVYYLACGFCRWSSRDVGIADRSVVEDGKEQENTAIKRVGTLVEYYRQLAQNEKIEREKKKLYRRRALTSAYMNLAITPKKRKDRFGISSLSRRKSSLSYLTAGLATKGQEMTEEEIEFKEPSHATENVETLPEEFYTKPLLLEKTPHVSQRLANPDFQPGDISELYPRHKHLLAKRSQRCRECEHNLSKPEFNPSSIKFKIQLGAVHYVPRIRIANIGSLECDKECPVTLSMTNPVENIVKVTLLPYEQDDEEKQTNEDDNVKENILEQTENEKNKQEGTKTEEIKEKDKDKEINNKIKDEKNPEPVEKVSPEKGDKEKEDKGKSKDTRLGIFDRKTERRVDNRCDSKAFIPTAEVVLPTFPLVLAARDEAAEFDDADVTAEMFNDDPRVVADRQANKLWFYIKVKPIKPTGDIKFSMIMQYDYKHALSALVKGGQEAEERVDTLRHKIHVNLGPIDSATAV